MGLCTEALINQVLCEETVTLSHLNRGVTIGEITIPPGSELGGQTFVSILDCTPLVQAGLFGVQITLFVQEELLLTTPQGNVYPLEFGFRLQNFNPLANCAGIQDLEGRLGELDCRTRILGSSNSLLLNGDATFDQSLAITIHVKILQESQLQIALCPPRM